MTSESPLPIAARRQRAELAARLYRQRRQREDLFGVPFGEPAWDILLDMERARLAGEAISIKSASLAACVPPTTALRYIALLEKAGLIDRAADDTDARRCFLTLTQPAIDAFATYFERVEYSWPRQPAPPAQLADPVLGDLAMRLLSEARTLLGGRANSAPNLAPTPGSS